MLADGEAEDVGGSGEAEAVSVVSLSVLLFVFGSGGWGAYMAVLCVRIVFSFNSNSWNLVGSSTFLSPVTDPSLVSPLCTVQCARGTSHHR